MDDNDQTDANLSGKAHAIPSSSRIGNTVEYNDSIDLPHTLGGSTTTTKTVGSKKKRSDALDDERIDFEKKPSAAASGNVLVAEFVTDIGTDDVIDETSEHALLSDETPPSKKLKINWKKPFDMPKRPLSAYNLFFRSQRQHLLGSEASIFPITDQAKRKHRKTHGKIGFEEMAKSVGQKWKDLDKESKSKFEQEAAIEKDKYTIAMEEYNRRKREAAKSGKAQDETSSSPFVSQHADLSGTSTDTGYDRYDSQQLQQQQNLLEYFSNDPISANIVERSRLFLDDVSSSRRGSHIGGSLSTSRLLDMSLGNQLRRQQQDLSSNLQQLYGTDALSQMMLMQADDSNRATERRSWHRSGSIDNDLLLDTSTRIPTFGSFLPDFNSSRNRLSSSDPMSLVDSLVATSSGTNLDQQQQEQQQQQERRRSWNLSLRNTDQGTTSARAYGIPYVSLQASDEELSEYYFCLLQEVMTVKDELDRRSSGMSLQQNIVSNVFGSATTSSSSRQRAVSSGGLPQSLSASIRDARRGLSLPLYDDVNMPPQQQSQQSYEREAELLSRARLLQDHVLQQQQQQQPSQQQQHQSRQQQQQHQFQILPQLLRRHSSMDIEPTSGTSSSTHAMARRVSDSQRSSNTSRQYGSSTLQDQQKKNQT